MIMVFIPVLLVHTAESVGNCSWLFMVKLTNDTVYSQERGKISTVF
jgi:hypothetical protein